MARKQLSYMALMSLSFAISSALSASADTTITRTVEPGVSSTTRLYVMPERPYSRSVTTITEIPFLGRENFARRLALMKQQLDNGVSRGWIDSFAAGNLYQRHADILAQIDSARVTGLSCEEANSLERQLNQFNIDLSDRMATASAGLIQ